MGSKSPSAPIQYKKSVSMYGKDWRGGDGDVIKTLN